MNGQAGAYHHVMDRSAPRVSRQELLAQTPIEILDALPSAPWRMANLHALALEVVQVPTKDLSWLLTLPLWQLDGHRFRVTPAAVAADPESYPRHYQRVMTSDLSYPIHCVDHQGRLVVLDGVHRLLQAYIRGRTTVDAMILSSADLDAISHDSSP